MLFGVSTELFTGTSTSCLVPCQKRTSLVSLPIWFLIFYCVLLMGQIRFSVMNLPNIVFFYLCGKQDLTSDFSRWLRFVSCIITSLSIYNLSSSIAETTYSYSNSESIFSLLRRTWSNWMQNSSKEAEVLELCYEAYLASSTLKSDSWLVSILFFLICVARPDSLKKAYRLKSSRIWSLCY